VPSNTGPKTQKLMSTETKQKPWYTKKIEELEARIAELEAGGDVVLAETVSVGGKSILEWVYDPEDQGKGHPGDTDADGNMVAFLTPLFPYGDGLRRPLFKRGVNKTSESFEFSEQYRFADRSSYDPTNIPSILKAMLDRSFNAAGLRDFQDINGVFPNWPKFNPGRSITLTIRVE